MINERMTQLKVLVPKQDKIDFQVKCTQNGTNMTVVIGDFVRQYLKKKGEIV